MIKMIKQRRGGVRQKGARSSHNPADGVTDAGNEDRERDRGAERQGRGADTRTRPKKEGGWGVQGGVSVIPFKSPTELLLRIWKKRDMRGPQTHGGGGRGREPRRPAGLQVPLRPLSPPPPLSCSSLSAL